MRKFMLIITMWKRYDLNITKCLCFDVYLNKNKKDIEHG